MSDSMQFSNVDNQEIDDLNEKSRRDYREKWARHRTFTEEVQSIVTKNLIETGVDVAVVEGRTKSVESFFGKISRDDKTYSKPLEEVTDLSGCRVITYYNDDIDTVEEIIRNNFIVDERNSERKDNPANPKEFGYLSRHLIVSMNEDRLKLGEFKSFKTHKAEIQIRSVLQHAWAAIEHKLQYKNKHDIPEPIQRRLFQISAILEMADDQFKYVRRKVGTLRDEYKNEIKAGETTVPVNVDSVDVFLETSTVFAELRSHLDDVGVNVSPRPKNSKNPLSKLNQTLFLAKIKDVA
tara:strand:+ start:86 stop:967 length:882 start_codon:yes stop_codon:yes gene_type:complete